jgi:hypothetical protein
VDTGAPPVYVIARRTVNGHVIRYNRRPGRRLVDTTARPPSGAPGETLRRLLAPNGRQVY